MKEKTWKGGSSRSETGIIARKILILISLCKQKGALSY
ncbi:hypothetical protein HM1_2636 [Heliomicrobium modesticaldum Ice1]|uniref:Uncharacterized protein n=1 Tax=Heliobacterium modesticaldum (strain ATCC 51547 / Ice1) TaxID=498761 RepID=B0TBF2_HELMI|nr:hypothetical protein HM1_2636 [Heliomicrobium modesticaldum Ice1]